MLYVVGAPQALHLSMVFAASAMAGWLQPPAEAVHVAVRPGARSGPQDVPEPQRRPGATSSTSSTRRSSAGRRRVSDRNPDLTDEERRDDRSHRRHRRAEVRRPVDRPRARLHLRLGPDAVVRRQHRAVPAVRAHPDLLDLPQGRRSIAARCRADVIARRRAGRAGARRAAPRVRGGRARDDRALQPAPAVHVPVRARVGLHRRSTSTARCSRPSRRSATAGSRSATSPARVLAHGLGLLGIDAPDHM